MATYNVMTKEKRNEKSRAPISALGAIDATAYTRTNQARSSERT
jgi:hypothetical protein